jgi:uncharacterized protein (DUF302 family)
MKQLILGVVALVVSASALAAHDNGLITKPSKYSVAETADKLENVLKSKGMTIFARVDHAGEAAKVGLTMRPTVLLIFGNPKGGTPLMVAAPTAAIDLPMKALAWQDAKGKVWLSYNTVSYIKERHDMKGMDEAVKNLDATLDKLSNLALE